MVKKRSSGEEKKHNIAVQNATVTRKTKKKPDAANECKMQRVCTLLQKARCRINQETVTKEIGR